MTNYEYFLGVDIGGSNSRAMIASRNGQVVGYGASGAGNWEVVGYPGLEKILINILDQALEMAQLSKDSIKGAGFGLAGYDWPSQRENHLSIIRNLNLDCPVEIVNDATLGILAGTSQGWGVSVVSGTGCNCRGWSKDRVRFGRAVGGATEWSNEGTGALQLVMRALRSVSFEWTCRGPKTALTQAFINKFGALNIDDLIEGLYLEKYRADSLDALLVFQIAHQGDQEAINVVRWAGMELGKMACGVIRQLGVEEEEFEVVLIGSLYDGHPLLIESMREMIHEVGPRAQLIRLKAPPVIGGILLGMELAGMDFNLVREPLISSANEVLSNEKAKEQKVVYKKGNLVIVNR